ncbi:alpha/beta fold hydrolase [Streptomyces sp. NBC_01262]|uniref:alpha/beta fold hydrolase n=1 Tax=Streptomyces sp. NBC_01262 TaxID=2903803 RepID=UPI002E2F118F|nr:alpha/beta hydrolase [Streptomyces sp. NBC_01262]
MCLAGGPGEDVRSLGNLEGMDRHRTLILMDARASGASEVPADRASCSYTEQSRDLDALRRHLGLEHIDVLAHSAGALTAQHYAASDPNRVSKLVLVTPAGRIRREVNAEEVAALRTRRVKEPWYRSAAEATMLLASGASGEELELRLAPFRYGEWTPAAREHYYTDYVSPPEWLFEAFYRGVPSPGKEAERLMRLRTVSAQVLVLAGAEDCIAGTEAPRTTAAAYDSAQLEVLPGAGHYLWLDDPERFESLVAEFLTG